MAKFDSTKHPRGHISNSGGFSTKGQSEPEVRIESDRMWPAIEHEAQEWVSSTAGWGVVASRQSKPFVSYDSAVPALIAERDVHISPATAALVEDATEALIRFDSSLGSEIAPFASLLLRSEAVASSRIENLTASARSILTAELGVTAKQNATIIAANTRAMRSAIDLADELTTDSVLKMHQVLMESDPRITAGEWRAEPVWIGTSSLSPVGATFVAPDSRRVPALMNDVMSFARRDNLPRLTQAAIAHAQFETIHPFPDGNGRTGRALIQSMLRGKGVTRNVTVPVSAGLLSSIDSYHDSLTEYRAGDPEPLVRLTAEASFLAVENAGQLVSEVHDIRSGWKDAVRARRGSGVWAVLDLVARQPVIDAAGVARHLGIAPTNAYTHLRSLTDAGVLKAKAEYQGTTLWRNDAILSALDRFATRSGRRGL